MTSQHTTRLLKHGDRVKIDGKEGEIVDVLSAQYFVEFDDGTDSFYFHKEIDKKNVIASREE